MPGLGQAEETLQYPTPNTQRLTPIEDWEILDLLTSLADKSLAVYTEREGTARYRLLETVKQYAGDRLAERGGRETLRHCHRDYYLTLAKASHPWGKDALRNLELLETEHDNLRAALTAAFDGPESVEQALEAQFTIGTFRRIRGYYSEGRDSLQTALAAPGKGPTDGRARALIAAVSLSMEIGNYDEANRFGEESVAIRRELNDAFWLANALMNHGNVLCAAGDFTAAQRVLEEGLEISLATGGSGMGLYGNLGVNLFRLGAYERAETFAAKEVALNRAANAKEWEAGGLYYLGRIALARADYAAASGRFTQTLDICCEMNFRPGLLAAIHGFSLLAAGLNQPERAASLLGANDALSERIGSRLSRADQPEYDRYVASLRIALGTDGFTAAYEAGRVLDWPQAIALAREAPSAG